MWNTKFLRFGLLISGTDIEEFIIDASQILLVTEDEIGGKYNFYNALEKLSA